MKVAVIGGGIGGLAVANLLAKQGHQVTVHEKNNQLGGRMGIIKKDGFTFDSGPSWYLMPEVLEHYFSLLGKKVDDYYKIEKLKPAYKVFFDYANPVTISGNLNKDKQSFESIEPGSANKLESYVNESKLIYDLAIKYFLYNPFASYKSVLNKEVLGKSSKLFVGLTKPLHGFVNKKFKNKQLQQILEYSMVFLGTSPFKAPSLYRLMSYLDFEQGVYFPKGGMYKITEAFTSIGKELGVKYKLNSNVTSINVINGEAKSITVANKVFKYDLVISNSDLAHTETKLLDKKYRTYPKEYWDKKESAPTAILLYLGIKGKLPELKHHNLLFVKEWKQNFEDIYKNKNWPNNASMYVSKTSASDKSVAPKNHENIFVLIPLPTNRRMSKDSLNKLVDKYIGQIETMTKISDFSKRIVTKIIYDPSYFKDSFNSWQSSALGLNHTLSQSAMFRPGVKSKKVSNLYYVGAMTQPGIGIPMCLISAELVIKSLANDKTSGPLIKLP